LRRKRRVGQLERTMHEVTFELLVTMNGESLGEEVGEVVGTRAPIDVKIAITYAITYPVIPHVDGFRTFGLHSVISDANRASVVAEDGYRFLWVTEGEKDGAEPRGVLRVEEESGVFGLGDGRADGRYDRTDGEEGSIDGYGVVGVATVEEATSDRTST